MEVIAFIGLGANLGDPRAQIAEALRRLGSAPETRLVRAATLYRSDPVGPPDQPEYFNTVAQIETRLEPAALLASVQAIERSLGRTRSIRWGPRLIDLDILLYGDRRIEEAGLVIPHPEITRRRFVLQPLFDLAPDLLVPGSAGSVRDLLGALEDSEKSVRRDA